ncbi:MAG: ATP-dependent endonuclease, partial [Dehalococcoidales bacterium]|nr:ATP-dependent endonuclease [Dehalococcoidales bacterium]
KFLTMAQIAERLGKATGSPIGSFTATSLRARLTNLMTPWVNEGFFANVVALVEGESDQSAILEVARQVGIDFEKAGISVIPVRGKTNLPIPFLIFSELGIPVYVVFDCDRNKGKDGKPEINKLLLKLCGYPEEESPDTALRVNMACFENELEDILKSEIGEATYNQLREQYSHELGYTAKEGETNPLVVGRLVQTTYERGGKIKALEQIVANIVALKR